MLRAILTTAALMFWVSSAQAKLEIENIQACYGPYGPERKSLDVYPFDELTFRFKVNGIQVDAERNVDTTASTQLADVEGNVLVANQFPTKAPLALGGKSYPYNLNIALDDQFLLGQYKLKVTVKDNRSGESASFERQITIKSMKFKIVAPQFFHDPDGKFPSPPGGCLGEFVFFRLRVIGVDRSQGKIHVDLAGQILDADGNEVVPKQPIAEVREDDATAVKNSKGATFNGSIPLSREGKYILRLTATDHMAEKSTKFDVPVQVTAP